MISLRLIWSFSLDVSNFIFIFCVMYLTFIDKCFEFAGDIKGIQGQGMPQYKNPFEFGNLYIKFDVSFPENHFTDEETLKVIYLLYFLLLLLLW